MFFTKANSKCCNALGLPEHFGRKKKDIFSAIVDRIKQKTVSWATRCLSGAGKFTLLKAVLTAIPTYTLSCFKIPLSLCKRIQSALTRFWWDSNKGEKKMCWVAWKTLAKPKKMGGLGFREVEDFNSALLGKLSWRLLNNPLCLLSRVLLGKYCKDLSFLEVKPANNSSHGWQSILVGRDLLAPHTIKAIGDGKNTNIWRDSWILNAEIRAPVGPAPIGENLKSRGLLHLSKCPRCSEEETAKHLFFDCVFAKNFWEQAPLQTSMSIGEVKTFEDALRKGTKIAALPPSGVGSGPLFPWLCWTLWTARNKLIFQNRVFTAADCISKAVSEASFLLILMEHGKNIEMKLGLDG